MDRSYEIKSISNKWGVYDLDNKFVMSIQNCQE